MRPATREVPSYVWLQKFCGGAMPPDAAYMSGGFLGPAHAPLAVGTKDHTQDPPSPLARVRRANRPVHIPGRAERMPGETGRGRDLCRRRRMPPYRLRVFPGKGTLNR
jgi:hypothetical protein